MSYALYLGISEVIADPGTYLYSEDPESAWFKREEAHNVLHWPSSRVNELKRFFRWSRTAPEPTWRAGSGAREVLLASQSFEVGAHWYRHQRSWELHPTKLLVRDRFASNDRSPVVSRLNIAPSTKVEAQDDRRWLVLGEQGELQITSTAPGVITPSWYAPHYGVRVPTTALEWVIESSPSEREVVTRLSLP
jgi:hypothetical protein